MKKTLRIALTLFLILGLTNGLVAQAESTATLYADFSYGDVEAENLVEQYELNYDGELTADLLTEGLSDLTGLDFDIDSFAETDDGLSVDWAAESTLLSGLDDREQVEGFFFYDVDSLSWFMMDSLLRTLKENLGVENIYYTMDGGEDLHLPALGYAQTFPADIPYMGSAFYAAHDNDDALAVSIESPLILVETIAFDGMQADSSAAVEGGYRFDDVTADGIVRSTNMAFSNPPDVTMSGEAYAEYCIERMQGDEPFSNVRVFEDEGYAIQFSYPVMLCYWDVGANEDLRTNIALVIPTDTHTYLYRLSVSADFYDEMHDEVQSVFSGLMLEDL